MRQFCLNLDKDQQRPVVVLNNLTALLDTGAYIPVWVDDEDILKSMFNAEFIIANTSLRGFGGETYGNLYRITLSVGDLVFPNIPIIACNDLRDTPFQLILSSTMFSGLIYEIDDKNHKLNITIPDDEDFVRNLKVIDEGGRLHVLCTSVSVESSYNKCENAKDLAAGFRKLYKDSKKD